MKFLKTVFIITFIITVSSFTFVPEEPKINWISFEEAMVLSKKEPKLVFIDFYTSWCGWCKRMDATTFQHPEVVKYMNANFYMVKFDAEQKNAITFKGKEFTFVKPPTSRRGYHELAATIMRGKLSYPTIAFMDEKMNLIQAIPGYRQTNEFYKIAYYMGEKKFRSQAWTEYEKGYKAPF